MYCREEMVKFLKCYLIQKKSYGTFSKGAIFLANPVERINNDTSYGFLFVDIHTPDEPWVG